MKNHHPTSALRVAVLHHPAEAAAAADLRDALRRAWPGPVTIEAACSPVGYDAALVLSGPIPAELPVIVLAPESSRRSEFTLPATSDPNTLAGALLAQIAATARLDELRAELRVERAIKASVARLIDEHQVETTLAVLIQRALLPRLPVDVPGVEAAVLYRPSASLSGDLYDITVLDDDHVALFVADACGHGIAAALLTMLIGRLLPMKEIIHHADRIIPPGEAMARLNIAYGQRQPDPSRLITAIYAVMNIRTGEITVASAGHPPAAIVGPDGARVMGDSGPSLGMIEDAQYPQVTVRLKPGEAILLYSDGFEWAFEAEGPRAIPSMVGNDPRRPNEQYLAAFAAMGTRLATSSAPGAVEALVADIDRTRGSLHQPDDITLLALCWRGAQQNAMPMPLESPGAARPARAA